MNISWKKMEHRWRKQLLSYARGNVLEVPIGTGNNFQYYPLQAKVTAVDISARMIEKAKQAAIENGINAGFIVSPVEGLKLPDHSFDTIVSTFSISEYENPVWVLNQFNTWCKPEGTILLMEQGLSTYPIIRTVQKIWDARYYKRTGSHINRDIKAVINSSGLSIKKVERKLAGVIYMVWASPGIEQSGNELR